MRIASKLRRGLAIAPAGLAIAAVAAVVWTTPAPAYLDAQAAYSLAVRHHHPLESGRPNFPVALLLYCRADSDDYAPAAYAIGLLYAAGDGVKRNDRLAGAWFRRAAALGSEDAREMLSLYKSGGTARCPYGWGRGGSARTRLVPPTEIKTLVDRLAPRFKLDPKLVLAVISVESAFQADAVSSANAQGLMQLIPQTAERFGVRDPFDPEQNLRGGMAYLKWLLRRFEGNVTLSLAAYNAGENAVDRYKGIPPYDETRRYVRKIRRLYDARTHPF